VSIVSKQLGRVDPADLQRGCEYCDQSDRGGCQYGAEQRPGVEAGDVVEQATQQPGRRQSNDDAEDPRLHRCPPVNTRGPRTVEAVGLRVVSCHGGIVRTTPVRSTELRVEVYTVCCFASLSFREIRTSSTGPVFGHPTGRMP